MAGIGNDTTIITIDGVSMLAIQALEQRTAELKVRTDELEKMKANFEQMKAEIEKLKNLMGAKAEVKE